jgi:branched-chain amino acid transport system ATP-binding protein
MENVEIGAVGVGVKPGEARERATEFLKWMGLEDRANLPAHSLSAGDERRLGIMRAIAMHPYFVLMDEPAAGLNERESKELMQIILKIREQYGCGILVIEHDVQFIMRLSDRVVVLDYGCIISKGTPKEVREDSSVISAYFGKEEQ